MTRNTKRPEVVESAPSAPFVDRQGRIGLPKRAPDHDPGAAGPERHRAIEARGQLAGRLHRLGGRVLPPFRRSVSRSARRADAPVALENAAARRRRGCANQQSIDTHLRAQGRRGRWTSPPHSRHRAFPPPSRNTAALGVSQRARDGASRLHGFMPEYALVRLRTSSGGRP